MADFGTHGAGGTEIAEIAQAWVAGDSIRSIADRYFNDGNADPTSSISQATRAIYRSLSMAGAWGLSALAQLPRSGIDFEALSPDDLALINSLPARLYHGVNTDDAVLMRMAGVPRSIATRLGERFGIQEGVQKSPAEARAFLRSLALDEWQAAAPADAAMSGADYRSVWGQLSGESALEDNRIATG